MNTPLLAQDYLDHLLAALWEPNGARPEPATIPWGEVLPLVAASSLGAAVYRVLQANRQHLPVAVAEELKREAFVSALANTRCALQLAQLHDLLSPLGGPLLLLKGVALGQQLYGDPALRLVGDIDLVVRAEQVPACRRLLQGLGYALRDVEPRPGSDLAFRNEIQFSAPEPFRAPVELHWHLLDVPYYLRRVPMEWFWENSEELVVGARIFRVLTPEANMVYLPAHLALHHRFRGLHSWVDLALLIVREGPRINWERVFSAAQSFDLLTAMTETLQRLAVRWPGLPLEEPLDVAKRFQPSATDVRLFRLLTAESRSSRLDVYTTLATMPSFAARVRYAWANLFPQPAYMRKRYRVSADWRLPYWYLHRLAVGLPGLARVLPQARRLEGEE